MIEWQKLNEDARSENSDRAGQAVVEFLVGLVAVLVLFAALLQMASLNKAHTDTMVEARRQAGELAMLQLGPGLEIMSDPDYILNWQEGPDGKRHTRDDRFSSASPAAFNAVIVDLAAPNAEGWTIIDSVPDNRLTGLHNDPDPVAGFGLVRGHHSVSDVPLLPAVQSLLYRAESIDVESEVWLTWTKGIY